MKAGGKFNSANVMQNLRRFLEIVQRDAGAEDVFIRVGGAQIENSDKLLSVPWRDDVALILQWSAAPEPTVLEKAQRIATEFVNNAFPEEALEAAVHLPTHAVVRDVSRELDEALGLLARRARAEEALIIDHKSPEIWGSSEYPRHGWNLEDVIAVDKIEHTLGALGLSLATLAALATEDELQAALREKGLESTTLRERARDVRWAKSLCEESIDPAKLRIFRALASARAAETLGHDSLSPTVRTRAFANIYRVVLVYDDVVSDLHFETAIHKMLPVIERLLLALPPRDPMSTGGRMAKVQPLRRLRPV